MDPVLGRIVQPTEPVAVSNPYREVISHACGNIGITSIEKEFSNTESPNDNDLRGICEDIFVNVDSVNESTGYMASESATDVLDAIVDRVENATVDNDHIVTFRARKQSDLEEVIGPKGIVENVDTGLVSNQIPANGREVLGKWKRWARLTNKSGSLYGGDIVMDYRQANFIGYGCKRVDRVGLVRWIPPSSGLFKINTDATIDGHNGKVGIGIIIRDAAGEVLASSALPISAGFNSQIAEATAILKGLQLGISLGLRPCVVESDCLSVVKLISSGQVPFAEIGLIIQDVVNLLGSSPGSCVVFAHMERNKAAHMLAKICLTVLSDFVWMEDFPPSIALTVFGDRPVHV
ncbi:hypothetical protein Ddye_030763 [Dipteronia dyeriana]|uniref:RNase H type-1 domain-containing protein n=1 Tax=Dipteronia dyeriana TaxID=168575 RepID=A0AAD9WLV8_9ROSI|nr:hypothetical protein Ddye_030763 [Dipteronia dyeriana]